MAKFIEEFKAFAVKGNAIDMAVGVIIGGAFGKIVTSIVNDVIMPPIGVLVGGMDFKDLKWTIAEKVLGEDGETVLKEAVTINYGNFIQTTIDFLLIALCVFMMVKFITKLTTKKKAEEPAAPPAPPAPSAEEKLLTEIRDLLKNQAQ